MKKNTKIFIFLFCVVFVLSSFSLFCFADSIPYGDYVFNEFIIFPSDLPSAVGEYINLSVGFECNGFFYDTIHLSYDAGSYTMYYQNSETDDVEYVYSFNAANGDSGIWYDDSFRSIYITGYYFDDNDSASDFLLINEYKITGAYSDIYSIIFDLVGADFDDDPSVRLSVSLVSLVLTLLVVLIPVIVVLFLIKYVLAMRF